MTFDESSNCLVIIPARGGSKGIPRKNLLEIAGKPLIAWTIEAVARAAEPMRCIVTTEDEDIGRLAIGLGAEVVMRPQELATDEAPTEPSLIHVLEWLADLEDYDPQEVVLLQPTSPVRKPGTLDAAVQLFRDSAATSLVGVVEQHPFLWRGPTDEPTPLYDVDSRPRRQDLNESQRCYRETGSIYITNPAALRASKNRISGRTVLFVLSDEEGDDIDTVEDVARVAAILEGGPDAARP